MAIVTNFFFLHIKSRTINGQSARARLIRCLREVDWVGLILFFGAIIQLLFALQEGGVNRPWSDSVVIGCFAGTAATVVVLCVWTWWRGEDGYIRPRLLKNRTMLSAIAINFAIPASYFTQISVLYVCVSSLKGLY